MPTVPEIQSNREVIIGNAGRALHHALVGTFSLYPDTLPRVNKSIANSLRENDAGYSVEVTMETKGSDRRIKTSLLGQDSYLQRDILGPIAQTGEISPRQLAQLLTLYDGLTSELQSIIPTNSSNNLDINKFDLLCSSIDGFHVIFSNAKLMRDEDQKRIDYILETNLDKLNLMRIEALGGKKSEVTEQGDQPRPEAESDDTALREAQEKAQAANQQAAEATQRAETAEAAVKGLTAQVVTLAGEIKTINEDRKALGRELRDSADEVKQLRSKLQQLQQNGRPEDAAIITLLNEKVKAAEERAAQAEARLSEKPGQELIAEAEKRGREQGIQEGQAEIERLRIELEILQKNGRPEDQQRIEELEALLQNRPTQEDLNLARAEGGSTISLIPEAILTKINADTRSHLSTAIGKLSAALTNPPKEGELGVLITELSGAKYETAGSILGRIVALIAPEDSKQFSEYIVSFWRQIEQSGRRDSLLFTLQNIQSELTRNRLTSVEMPDF